MSRYRLCPHVILILFVCFTHGENQAFVTNPCESDELPCDNVNECIKREAWCDYESDCTDGSDEEFCREKAFYQTKHVNNCPKEKYFTCNNAKCFPLVTVCDGIKDCKDGEDEEQDCSSSADPSTEVTTSIESTSGKSMSVDSSEEDLFDITSEIPTASEIPEVTTAVIRDSKAATSARSNQHKKSSRWPAYKYRPSQQRGQSNLGYYESQLAQPMPNAHHSFNTRENQQRYPQQVPVPRQSGQSYGHSYTYAGLPLNQHQHYDDPGYGSSLPVHESYGPEIMSRPYSPSSRRRDPNSHHSSRQQQNHYPHLVTLQRNIVCSPAHQPTDAERYSRFPLNGKNMSRNALLPFRFQKDFTEIVGRNRSYRRAVEKARAWILKHRNSSYEWGEDTPRALTTLSLINNSFFSENTENDLMKKRLAMHLSIKLLQIRTDRTTDMSDSRLAIYINSLIATCQNPHDFMDHDLTELLIYRKNKMFTSREAINPLVYITLCLLQSNIEYEEIRSLIDLVYVRQVDEQTKDQHILATTALACLYQQDLYKNYLRPVLEAAAKAILQEQYEDGSFGSIYSTALAAQALMSINTSLSWDPNKTLAYLANHQMSDGSFGDMLATYLIVPVLSGRSLLHLRNTQCEPTPIPDADLTMEDIINSPGPKKQIIYHLNVGIPVRPLVYLPLTIPQSFSFFDAMKMAEYLNPQFRFFYHSESKHFDVHTISDIPNDPERGYSWRLYIVRDTFSANPTINLREEFKGDIRTLKPRDCDELVFWYLHDSQV